MPATESITRGRHERGRRIVTGLLALVFVGSVGAHSSPPLAAADVLTQITAMRSSQLYYEGAMRAADQQVRAMKQARKQARPKLRKARRNLNKAVSRRRTTRRKLIETRQDLSAARAAMAAASAETTSTPDTAMAALSSMLAPAAPAVIPGFVAGERGPTMPFPPAPTEPTAEEPPGEIVSARDIRVLEKKLKKQKRVYKKARKRARQVRRNVRAIRGRIAAVESGRRGAIARREYAEAALGYRIRAMAPLAQRRLAKRTDVRNAASHGFSWPAHGRISQGYGCTGYPLNPPRGSCRHFHDGVDIVSYYGAPIRAAAVGVVTYVGWNPWDRLGRAFIIVVEHPGGYETMYGHLLPTRRVRAGQVVKKGEVIGYMGNTGRSTGTHLHFELRRGSSVLNPLAFL